MAQQTIGVGSAANDGTGDPVRTAFQKVNDNFTELYGGAAGIATNPTLPSWVDWTAITVPSAPSTGETRLYGVSWAGTPFIGERKPGLPAMLQAPALVGLRMFEVRPQSGTAISVIGCGSTNTGTISTPAPASTDYYTQTQRFIATSAATANTTCGWRAVVPNLWIGNASGLGGFHVCFRAGIDSFNSDSRVAIGLSSSNAGMTGDASSNLADFIGVEKATADTNLFFARRTGTGAATRVDLGVAAAASQLIEMHLAADSNGSEIRVRVDVFDTAGARTTLLDTAYSTAIPANTTMLGPRVEGRTATTATAIAVTTSHVWGIGGA